jgi:hypothetical protein
VWSKIATFWSVFDFLLQGRAISVGELKVCEIVEIVLSEELLSLRQMTIVVVVVTLLQRRMG